MSYVACFSRRTSSSPVIRSLFRVLLLALLFFSPILNATLIQCPECGNSISSQAPACPQCGVQRSLQPPRSKPKHITVETQPPFDENKTCKSIVLIRTTKGSGTGFVLRVKDKKYIITNQHLVLGGMLKSISTLDNDAVQYSAIQLHADLDLARLDVSTSFLEPLDTDSEPPTIGANVWVVGNSLGARVLTRLSGVILGIGPDTLETDAQFVPGNSGSPILSSSGRVLGVASFMTQRANPQDWVTKGTRFAEPRRFGYRLRTDAKWIQLADAEYDNHVSTLSDLDTFVRDWVLLFVADNENCEPEWRQIVTENGGLDAFRKSYTYAKHSPNYMKHKQLCAGLENVLNADNKYRAVLDSNLYDSNVKATYRSAAHKARLTLANLPSSIVAKAPRTTVFMTDAMSNYDSFAAVFKTIVPDRLDTLAPTRRSISIDSRREQGSTIADSVSAGAKIVLRYKTGSWQIAPGFPPVSPDAVGGYGALGIFELVKSGELRLMCTVPGHTAANPFTYTLSSPASKVVLRINDSIGACGDNAGKVTYEVQIVSQ